jgi:NAD(P)-dependent dehydrogenase (short-subunit alcohol dehydrogenase family)
MTGVEHGPGTRVVVVAGGSGTVGGAVVRALLARGDEVVVPTRGDGAGAPQGSRVVAGLDWQDPRPLDAALAGWGLRPSAAVAAIGGWWQGAPLVEVDPALWRDLVESHLTAHLLAVQALAARLVGPDRPYVLLGGAAAEEPMRGSGPVNVTGAAQRMLLHVLRAEGRPAGVRFHEVNVGAAVAGDVRNLDPVAEVAPDDVAAAVLATLDDPATPAVRRIAGR